VDCNEEGWSIKDIDGKTAFSDGDLEEIVGALERDMNKVCMSLSKRPFNV
jgi:hypothetical protein